MVKRYFAGMVFALCVTLAADCVKSAPDDGRTVVDMAGNPVRVPVKVNRIGCLEVLCYEKLFLLGASDRIEMMTMTNAPWMRQTNPAVDAITKIASDPDIEELLRRRVDVVFHTLGYPNPKKIERLAQLGIPLVVSQSVGKPPVDSMDAFVESRKRMLRLYASVLGPIYETRAEEWCAYLDRMVAYVLSRTKDIPAEQRIRLYHVRGPSVTRTHGRADQAPNTFWYGEIAGADMVVKRISDKYSVGEISIEELLKWNPQVIHVSRQYSAKLVTGDPRLQQIEAVQTGRVYELPEGVFYWDGSTEGVLLMLYIAKELYPERFTDLDIRHEIRSYYAKFYRYPLSDSELDLLLQGKAPDGRRFNNMNN
jgi:iron complex transport system substrate-binding protein